MGRSKKTPVFQQVHFGKYLSCLMIPSRKLGRQTAVFLNAFSKPRSPSDMHTGNESRKENLYEGKANAAANLGGQVKGYLST